MTVETKSREISNLPDLVDAFPPEDKELFQRIFKVSTSTGEVVPPSSMNQWLTQVFGSPERVKKQKITKITNLLTLEGSLFNQLRGERPMDCKVDDSLREMITQTTGDPFCHPQERTPADTFGRVKGSRCISASNVAKYDGFHGVLISKEHNPLAISREAVVDYFETGMEWAHRAMEKDPAAKYYFFMWNCLWKSGASILHGHAQVTLTRDLHYPKVERQRRAMVEYQQKYQGNYFADLYRVHKSLGLAWEWEQVKGFTYLTPIKEKEVILMAEKPGTPLYHAVHKVLEKYLSLCSFSFNVALYLPPLQPTSEEWDGFPALVRIVDRGDPNNRTADFGAMELYAASVISSDPFKVADYIKSPGPKAK